MEPQNKKSVSMFIAPMLFLSGLIFLFIGGYFMYTSQKGDASVVQNVLFVCGFFDLILAAGFFVWHRRQKENL